jgi:hypothetical protein
MMQGSTDEQVDAPEAMLLDHTYAGIKPSNANHELCRYTGDVTRMLASSPAIVGPCSILECNALCTTEQRTGGFPAFSPFSGV